MANGHGNVIRFSGVEEEKYQSWKLWAKGFLRKKVLFDHWGALKNEPELAAELLTLIEPAGPASEAIKHLNTDR